MCPWLPLGQGRVQHSIYKASRRQASIGARPGILFLGAAANHELWLHVERSGFRSTVEERDVRSQTHIEGRHGGALEHHTARLVA